MGIVPNYPRPFCCIRFPPCPNKAGHRSGRCDEHERAYQRPFDRERGSGGQRGWSKQWATFRKQYLLLHPRCECTVCIAKPYWARPIATDIDHIDGTGRGGARAYDVTNLRAMSHEHHSQRTARDQPGGWARRDTD